MGDKLWVEPAAKEEKESKSVSAADNQSAMLAQQNELLSKQITLEKLKAQKSGGDGESKQIAAGMKKGMSEGLRAGGNLAMGAGKLGWNAVGRPTEGWKINLFVGVAVLLSWSQATLGYRNRATVFFLMLGTFGWLMVFKGDSPLLSRASLVGLAKSFAIAALTWYWPVIFYKIPVSFASSTVKLILISAFNPYILYFVFLDPMTPLLQRVEKMYIFAIVMIFLGWGIKGLSEGSLLLEPIQGVDTKAGLVLFWEMSRDSTKIVYEWIGKGYEDVETWVLDRVDYATGGALYAGQKDPDAETRLGVYYKEMKTTHSDIYDDEPLTVWAQIEASTLDDPIHMVISCLGDRDVGNIDPKKNIPSDSVIPTEIDVDRKDKHDIDCSFNAGKLPAGSHTVSITVDFDFTTNAKQKAYFVDKEKAQALARNDVDILEQYGIRDKNPTATYTDGPIMVGMGFTNQPVKLDSSNNQPATLGISMQKRWDGKITHINSMTVRMPGTMEIVDANCNGVLFTESQDGESHVYTMREPASVTKFEPYRTFRCPIEFNDVDGILGSVPVATRFFQVEVDYGYQITKDLSVSIKNSTLYDSTTGIAKPATTTTTTTTNTTEDNDADVVSDTYGEEEE